MRGKRSKWAPLLLLLLLLTGCWDQREIEERSTVLATSVDLCTEGESCTLVVSRQFAIPGRIPLGAAGGGGGSENTVFVLSSPGKDGPDTARRAQGELNRTLSFGHSRVLVFSEEFARRGVVEYVDYVRRIPDARRLIWIAIAEGRAEDVIRARPPLERVPALFLTDMFEDAVKRGRLPKIFWGEFLTDLSNRGEDAFAPLIRMAGPDKPGLAGLAVFRDDRMVGKLTPEETVTFMEVQGAKRGAELLTIDLPGGRRADVRVYGRKANYGVSTVRGQIHATIKIELESELVAISHDLRSSDPHVREMIEGRTAAEVTRRAVALVHKLQKEFGADILGLGERVRAYQPATWKSTGDWHVAFANAQFHFAVKVHVRRSGMGMD